MMMFMERAQQAKIVDAGDEAVAVVCSEAFRAFAPHFQAVGFDVGAWGNELAQTTAAARESFADRSSVDDAYRVETAEVQDVVTAFETWVRTLRAAAHAHEVMDNADAKRLSRMLGLPNYEGGSNENVHYTGPNVLRTVIGLGDLTAFGLPASFVEEAQRILDALLPERSQVWDRAYTRVCGTEQLHAHLDRVVLLMERYARFREFAMLRSGREIPEFSLAALRAGVAPRRAAEVEAPVSPPTLEV